MSFTVEQELRHQGICDSSGAIALDRNHFVVANDEDNLLRVYAAHQSGHPIFTQDINAFFENNPDAKEVDLEAAAQLGDIIYWITSHGRNKKGKFKPERHQFFASRLSDRNTFEVEQVGRSYIQLVLEDMLNDPRLDRYAIREAEQLPPKEPGGLNIEGLSITPEGELLIGFRSPVVRGNALLVPLKNPDALVAGAKAILGDPIELDLDGLGIRSIEYWASQNCYLIVAGAGDGGDRFALYQWSGTSESPRLISGTGMPYDFHPEGVLFYGEEGDRFQLLSDDGSLVRVGDLPCKEVEDAQHPQKYFRSLWVKVHQG
ncbi:MAG: DUF3616 domain-containing protein [Oculatellaceae cyanobacterium Prado106]|nr:DUF3616 domain-containing protein [Oculatellaceae cyanobacterium Prado106]